MLSCLFVFFVFSSHISAAATNKRCCVLYMKSLRLPHVQQVRSRNEDHAPRARTRVSPVSEAEPASETLNSSSWTG